MNKKKVEYTRIAKKIINSMTEFEDLKNSDLKFCCVASDVEKTQNGKIVYADCMKVNKARYDFCCPYDFIITVYEPNVVNFTDEQMKILLEHEVRHMGVRTDGNEPSFYIIPHDVEDFWAIIDRHGWDWQKPKEE